MGNGTGREGDLCGEGDIGEKSSSSRSRQVRYRAKDKGSAALGVTLRHRGELWGPPPGHGEGRHLGSRWEGQSNWKI